MPALVAGCLLALGVASAAKAVEGCPISQQTLKTQLQQAAKEDSTGLDNDCWAVVVNRAGVVCAVAYSGENTGSQWLLSRQIAAAKAFTANGLSLDDAATSTAWRLRMKLTLGPSVASAGNDRITLNNATGHPHCPNDAGTQGAN
ncbi:MAG: hypothetical protein KDG89_17535 [Geminicoccaceae bacterium]|nr:hypothetical protein [Geminicoccaceae bacterium]